MKPFKLLIFLLLTILACGCGKTEPDDSFGSIRNFRRNYYYFWLSIHDISGNDKFAGIGYSSPNESSGVKVINPSLYKFDIQPIIPSRSVKVELQNADELALLKLNDTEYVPIMAFSHKDYKATEITFKFTCPYVFGDTKEHLITTYWSWEEGISIYDIKMDGKTFPITPFAEEQKSPIPVAWIVLDE